MGVEDGGLREKTKKMDHMYKDEADSLPPIDHADFYGVRSHRYESESLVGHGLSF